MTESADRRAIAAQRAIEAHPNPEALFENGLKIKHWIELNHAGAGEEYQLRLTELRAEYTDSPVALQQIDVFDGTSEYNVRFKILVDAYKSGDTQAQVEQEVWFKEHYPYI